MNRRTFLRGAAAAAVAPAVAPLIHAAPAVLSNAVTGTGSMVLGSGHLSDAMRYGTSVLKLVQEGDKLVYRRIPAADFFRPLSSGLDPSRA